jgi:tripartite-type tricarboxylate transporter receptor subunit TctC
MKRWFVAGAAVMAAGGAWSQDQATRPIRMIVPFSGGSASDVITRILIERISARRVSVLCWTIVRQPAATSAHKWSQGPRPMVSASA